MPYKIIAWGALFIMSAQAHIMVVGHRGFAAQYPENTMVSFKAALAYADMIEFDVQLSKDGHVVIMHDKDLQRTAGVSGLVSEKTLHELEMLDAGSSFNRKFIGEKIPTLEQVLRELKGKIKFNIEIKNYGASDIAQLVIRTIDLVKKNAVEADVIVSSFDHTLSQQIHTLAPHLGWYLLFDEESKTDQYLDPQQIGSYLKEHFARGAVIDFYILKQEMVDALHKEGFKVGVFTPNTLDEIAFCAKLGVDFIISNYPDRVRTIVHH